MLEILPGDCYTFPPLGPEELHELLNFISTVITNDDNWHTKSSNMVKVHSKLRSITPVATKMHVILQSFKVLTWMRDIIELVQHVILWNNTKEM